MRAAYRQQPHPGCHTPLFAPAPASADPLPSPPRRALRFWDLMLSPTSPVQDALAQLQGRGPARRGRPGQASDARELHGQRGHGRGGGHGLRRSAPHARRRCRQVHERPRGGSGGGGGAAGSQGAGEGGGGVRPVGHRWRAS
eukprot:scaffold27038_cov124-Isochrysis_galbana.AAC.2